MHYVSKHSQLVHGTGDGENGCCGVVKGQQLEVRQCQNVL